MTRRLMTISLLALVALLRVADAATDEELRQAWSRVDRHFAGVLDWTIQLYDLKSGGFYASLAAKEAGFAPDLESTGFVVRFLHQNGLTATMPEYVRSRILTSVRSMQDSSLGTFVDPSYRENSLKPRYQGRLLGSAQIIFQSLNAKPLHPYPGGGTSAPSHLTSLDAFIQWFEDEIGPNPGYAGSGTGNMDLLSSQGALMASTPLGGQFIAYANSRLEPAQDPETGCWTHPTREGGIHGLFKYVNYAAKTSTPLPRPERMLASVMRWYADIAPQGTEMIGTGTYSHDLPRLGNPIRILEKLQDQAGLKVDRDQWLLILGWYDEGISPHVAADGGLSRFRDNHDIRILDAVIAKGDQQVGDVNGTHNILGARSIPLRLLGWEVPPLLGADTYWSRFALQHRDDLGASP